MTTIDPATVATMQGRELDAALQRQLFGFKEVELHPIGWLYRDYGASGFIAGHWHAPPHYSTDPTAFFAMVERVRELGLAPSIHCGFNGIWDVMLVGPLGTGKARGAQADTLPLAFARAALLTTIPNGGAS